MENKLKPCPFCGNGNITIVVDNVHHSLGIADKDEVVNFKVICSLTSCGCGASTPWAYPKENAVRLWNRRKGVKDDE